MNKKILLVYYKLFKPGGVARVFSTLANELINKGYDVTILLLVSNTSSFYDLDPRIKIISIDTFSHWGFTKINVNIDKYFRKLPKRLSIKNNIYDFGQWDMFSSWLKKNHQQYDVIISSWYKLSAQIATNKHIAAKTYAWEHSNFEVGGKIWGDWLRPKYKNLRGVICINKASFNYYKKLNNNTFIIPNIIGEPFESIENINFQIKKNQLIYVGRLDADKNVRSLIKAVQKSDLKDFKLKIIGDGPDFDNLKNYVSENKISDKIEFAGRLDIIQIKEELLRSKIFLFMSKTEAFGMVLLEALFCGNALISYDCKYGPSDIINKNNGFLIPMNGENMFIEKLESLINNPEMLENLNQSAFQDAHNWRKQKAIQQWINIIN